LNEEKQMRGQLYKEIERKAKKCVIEDGKTVEQCIKTLEKEYDLDEEDKEEIKDIIHDIR
jgi:hypothetical protein